MSLDKGSLTSHPLAKVREIGSPFHGVVQGGVLTLPNAQTMSYPDPQADFANIPWLNACTYYVKRPGWTAQPRSPEELAADAAAGHEWRDYALLSGQRTMLYGKSLRGGWIWFDPTGAAYLVELVDQTGSITSLALGFRFTRFGLLGVPPASSVVRTAPAIDMGQTGAPTINVRSTRGGSMAPLSDAAADGMVLVSTTPGGDKAIFMRFVRHFASVGNPNIGSTQIEKPIGFYEVTIATDGGVTVSTLKTRAQCIGTVSRNSPSSPPAPVGSLEVGVQRVAHTFTNEPWTDLAACGDGSIPKERTITPLTVVTPHPAASTPGAFMEYGVPQTGEWSFEHSGSVLAMWYDLSGTRHEIGCNLRIDVSVTSNSTTTNAGTRHEYFTCAPGGGLSGPFRDDSGLSWSQTDNSTMLEQVTLEVTDNGSPVSAAARVVTNTTVRSVVFNAASPTSWTLTHDITTTFNDGHRVPQVTESINQSLDSSGNGFFSMDQSAVFGISQLSLQNQLSVFSEGRFDLLPMLLSSASHQFDVEIQTLYLDLIRWSNHAIGSRGQEGYRNQTSGGTILLWLDEHVFSQPITPVGLVSAPTPFNTFGTTRRVWVSGSLQPVTSQLAAAVSIDDGVSTPNPKCWV